MRLESEIAGVPCVIHVTSYERTRGSYSRNAPSDVDYYGYTEIEYDVLVDGQPAQWLAQKMSDEEAEDIEQEIIDEMESLGGD